MDAFDQALTAHRERRYEDAHSLLLDCLESAANIHDGETLANGLLLFADNLLYCCPVGDDPFECRKLAAEEALKLFRDEGDNVGEARALLIIASADFSRGLELATESLRIARELCDNRLSAKAMAWIGNHLSLCGKDQESLAIASEAVQLARQCSDTELLVETLFTLGLVAANQPDTRIAAFEEMAALMPDRKGGFARRLTAAASLVMDDDPNRANDWYNRCLPIARELNETSLEAAILTGLSQIARARGEIAKADELEMLGKILLGPMPDFTEFQKAVESGDTDGAMSILKAIATGLPSTDKHGC